MLRAALTLALGLSLAGGSDIVSAAKALMPKGAHLVVAQELDATFGVAAYDYRAKTTALALRWQSGRWHAAAPGPIRIRVLEPRPGATIGRKPAYIHVKVNAVKVSGPSGIWLDGREVRPDFSANLESWYVIRQPRPGRHSVVVFVAAAPNAAARAWNFTVR
jgi:hypothetical protein